MKDIPDDRIWVTRDGREIDIREMGSLHLVRLIVYLYKHADARRRRVMKETVEHAAASKDPRLMFHASKRVLAMQNMTRKQFLAAHVSQWRYLNREVTRRNLRSFVP